MKIATITALLVSGVLSLPLAAQDVSEAPLTHEERQSLDAAFLRKLPSDQLNFLFTKLSSGPLPSGFYKGGIVLDPEAQERLNEDLTKLIKDEKLRTWVRNAVPWLWQGQEFDAKAMLIANRIGPIKRFPGQMYCGASTADVGGASIIVDYANSDTLPGYNRIFDWPMTKLGLGLKDEIRMVRPGLYLGRAYVRGKFLLNFLLEQEPLTGLTDWNDACRSAQ